LQLELSTCLAPAAAPHAVTGSVSLHVSCATPCVACTVCRMYPVSHVQCVVYSYIDSLRLRALYMRVYSSRDEGVFEQRCMHADGAVCVQQSIYLYTITF
jgi:hypothetical protein